MATTTKTLTPTNQQITLPDMTERPNNSTQVDSIGKLADAVNALNSNFSFVQIPSSTHLLDYALNLPAARYKFFSMAGSGAYGEDLPSNNFKWGMGVIITRLDTNKTVIMFASGQKPAFNVYNNTSWGGWKDFSGNAYA